MSSAFLDAPATVTSVVELCVAFVLVIVLGCLALTRPRTLSTTDEYRRLAQDLLKARGEGNLSPAEEEKLFTKLTEQWQKLDDRGRLLFNGGCYHPSQVSPYRTPADVSTEPESEPVSVKPVKPKPKSEADRRLDADAEYDIKYGKCRHIFLDSPSEPGYCRCKGCGKRATEQFAAEVREQRACEDAEQGKAAAFVREHNK